MYTYIHVYIYIYVYVYGLLLVQTKMSVTRLRPIRTILPECPDLVPKRTQYVQNYLE